MDILIVTNPEINDPIHCYTAKCTDDMFFDVKTAFEELDIKVSENVIITELIEEIAQELICGRNYWFNETYCFEVVTVPDRSPRKEGLWGERVDVCSMKYCNIWFWLSFVWFVVGIINIVCKMYIASICDFVVWMLWLWLGINEYHKHRRNG